MDKLRSVSFNELDAIEIGAAILGTGGGGNPYIGKLRCREELKKGNRINVIPLNELDDKALVVSLGGIGAPVVGIEKMEEGQECLRAMRALEQEFNCKIDALISSEIGGSNSMEPMLTAAQAGIPVVDGDGMGRAFPEMQMCTWSIYGHKSAPAAMADEKGNILVIRDTVDEIWVERLARSGVVTMGAAAGIAMAPMKGGFVKKYAIPNTITQALSLGRSVINANKENKNPIDAVLAHENGKLLMTGKIIDLERHLKGGFAVGQIVLEGFGDYQNDKGTIDLQNEFLVFCRNDKMEVCVPDLIVVLDSETGFPIGTELLRYGQRIAVLGLPCHDLLRSSRALDVIGPKAFGYHDLEYKPM